MRFGGVMRDAVCLVRMLLTEVVSCQVVDGRLHKGGLTHIRQRNGLVLCQCGQNYVFQSVFIHLSPRFQAALPQERLIDSYL